MWHAHVDSYHGARCQLNALGAIKDPGGEDDFGWYQTVNPIHRCSSTPPHNGGSENTKIILVRSKGPRALNTN